MKIQKELGKYDSEILLPFAWSTQILETRF